MTTNDNSDYITKTLETLSSLYELLVNLNDIKQKTNVRINEFSLNSFLQNILDNINIEQTDLENDIVLDNCAGSGSALVAAHKLNRKWIGIEKEKQYCDVIKNRFLQLDKNNN